MTTTTADVLAAIIRANGTADALRRAIVAMTRDGGNESAPSWRAYVAALANHDAATAEMEAARDNRWDDATTTFCGDCAESLSTDCPDCGGYGIITATTT